jgi:hypothetical protein
MLNYPFDFFLLFPSEEVVAPDSVLPLSLVGILLRALEKETISSMFKIRFNCGMSSKLIP